MSALYNEIEPYAAAWLGNLIDAGHIAPGRVDTRSIVDLTPQDIPDGQAHFFAGIGVWSHALRLAGVPDSVSVWTGSCPCQPFSAAGRRRGTSDVRHLWPEWFRLIQERRPPIIFGEQVASADGLGWLDAVQTDLEGAGYACAAFDLSAAGVGAPHIRQRLYFVAYSMGDTGGSRSGRLAGAISRAKGTGTSERIDTRSIADLAVPAGADRYWEPCDWIPCHDPQRGLVYRPVEPGTFPLAHGATSRVGRLRAYGNAIVAPLAAAFIRDAVDAILDL